MKAANNFTNGNNRSDNESIDDAVSDEEIEEGPFTDIVIEGMFGGSMGYVAGAVFEDMVNQPADGINSLDELSLYAAGIGFFLGVAYRTIKVYRDSHSKNES